MKVPFVTLYSFVISGGNVGFFLFKHALELIFKFCFAWYFSDEEPPKDGITEDEARGVFEIIASTGKIWYVYMKTWKLVMYSFVFSILILLWIDYVMSYIYNVVSVGCLRESLLLKALFILNLIHFSSFFGTILSVFV